MRFTIIKTITNIYNNIKIVIIIVANIINIKKYIKKI